MIAAEAPQPKSNDMDQNRYALTTKVNGESISMKQVFAIQGKHNLWEEPTTCAINGACFASVICVNPIGEYLDYLKYQNNLKHTLDILLKTQWSGLNSFKKIQFKAKWERIDNLIQHLMYHAGPVVTKEVNPLRKIWINEVILPILGPYKKYITVEECDKEDPFFKACVLFHNTIQNYYTVVSSEKPFARVHYDVNNLTPSQIFLIGDAFRLCQEHVCYIRLALKLRDDFDLSPDHTFILPSLVRYVNNTHKIFCWATTFPHWEDYFLDWKFKKCLDKLGKLEEKPYAQYHNKQVNLQKELAIGRGQRYLYDTQVTRVENEQFEKFINLRYGQ